MTVSNTDENTVQLELLNTRTFIAGNFETAIVPIGSCESHGDHLPLGMDALTTHALALRIASKVANTVVLPPTYFGMDQHYRHKPITISLQSATTIAFYKDVFESLIQGGINRIFILNGHDGNMPCWELAARETKVAHPVIQISGVDWWVPVGSLCPSDLFEVWSGGGHGGEAETSIGLELFPELIDMPHARGVIPSVDPIIKEIWLFEELTPYGATGAPAKATAKKGQVMADTVVDYIVDFLNKQRNNPSGFKQQQT